jgi:Tol biopolymer transport system component/tRNA A-37 threonylcarbamoyl transferase component Bud32
VIGQTLGHYRIEAKLGEGGMGVVYRALDQHLDRRVAIKVLRPETVADPERKRRFVQEAKAASALNHPNIITVYDIEISSGVDFIAMEYVHGKTLDQLIGRKGVGLGEALNYAVQAADALATAHAAGIIHRDVKPANIMVTDEGRVKMMDFGLAKLTEPGKADELATLETVDARPQTETGAIVGTIAYVSPEQAEGKPVDGRSDIYTFGSVLYEMLTGRRPFQRDTKLATLTAILREKAPSVSEIIQGTPPELERIIARCLRKDPVRRFQHMVDLKIALEELKEESEPKSGVARIVALLARPRRQRVSRWVGTAALLGLAVVIGYAVWFHPARRTAEPPAPPLKIVPFTSFLNRESSPAFSPDGSQVAFVWDGEKGDNNDIYVSLIGAGTPFRLTTHSGDDRYPAWSRDRRHIAFVRQSGSERSIFIVPALGGNERKLHSETSAFLFYFDSGPSWSPDGKSLVFPGRASPQEPNSIFSLSLENLEKRKLTSPPAGAIGDSNPSFSPDANTLAFTRQTGSSPGDIYLLPAAGGEPKRLTFDNRPILGLDWTADGHEIVFSSDRDRAGRFSLWRISASGGTSERLAVGGDNASTLAISRQGHRLAYTQEFRDHNIWRIQVPNSTGRRNPPTRLIASTRADDGPQFSPEGKRIVFASARSGNREIWMCDSEGLNPIPLTSFGGPDVNSPRWSPDGREIAFDSLAEGSRDIYVVSVEGGKPRRVTTEISDEVRPSWSRDGRWIYFGSNRSGDWQVWKAPAKGGQAVRVTREGGREAFESPDGKVYYAKGVGVLGIWKTPAQGGQEIRVLDQAVQGFWALRDRGIYFLNPKTSPHSAIEFLSFATGRTTQIAALEKEPTLASGLAVSPDGRWILHVQGDQRESDIMLVENFR